MKCHYLVLSIAFVTVVKTGRMFPFRQREIVDRNFLFTLNEGAGPDTCYVKIATASSLNFTPTIISYRSYISRLSIDYPIWRIYFGLMLVMAVHNLFVFASIRDFQLPRLCMLHRLLRDAAGKPERAFVPVSLARYDLVGKQVAALDRVAPKSDMADSLSQKIVTAYREQNLSMEQTMKTVERLSQMEQEIALSNERNINSTKILNGKSEELPALVSKA